MELFINGLRSLGTATWMLKIKNTGRSSFIHHDKIKTLIINNLQHTERKLAKMLKILKAIIYELD